MGLTNWPGERILPRDVTIAKNYLNEDELKQLNNIVEQYLRFRGITSLAQEADGHEGLDREARTAS